MSEVTTGDFALYAVLIVVMMTVLDWVESKRTRNARASRERHQQLDAIPARKAA